MKKILLIGPLPEPTTGVSLANKIVVEGLRGFYDFKIDFINTSYNKFEENLGSFSLSKLFFYLKINFFAYKVSNIDIVYITPGQTFFGIVKYSLFILLSKILGKELIFHVHGNYLGKEFSLLKGFKKEIFKFLISKASKGIVLSKSLKGNMSPFVKYNQIFVLYNFVEDYLFIESNDSIKEFENTPKIVFLSNLMQEKGIFDLLEALKILYEEGFEYKAKIAGNIDAKHKEKIENYISKLENVEYCGVVSGNEKRELLLWGNIFVLPTYYEMEGQPISILEAMATRNLILTTDHAGICDIFEDGINGFYVEKKSPKSISSKIKMVSENYKLSNKIREQNFLIANKKYRVNKFIDNFIKIVKA